MNKNILKILTIFLVLQASSVIASSHEDKDVELRKSFPIQVFMGTCVVGRAHPKNVSSQALEMGFKKAPKDKAANYLSGNNGKAWYLKNEDGEFGITVLENGLCSLFIHQGNSQILKESMVLWLPPQGSGFSYTTEENENNGLVTTVYKLYRGNSFMEQWMITIPLNSSSKLKAIMSYNAPKA